MKETKWSTQQASVRRPSITICTYLYIIWTWITFAVNLSSWISVCKLCPLYASLQLSHSVNVECLLRLPCIASCLFRKSWAWPAKAPSSSMAGKASWLCACDVVLWSSHLSHTCYHATGSLWLLSRSPLLLFPSNKNGFEVQQRLA